MNSILFVFALSVSLCSGPQDRNNPILQVLPQIIEAMNEHAKTSFSTTEAEYVGSIKGEDGSPLLYVDLAGENGYLLFDTRGAVVSFGEIGDIPEIRSLGQEVTFARLSFWDDRGKCLNAIDCGSEESDAVFSAPGAIAQNYAGAIEYSGLGQLLSTKYSVYDWTLVDSGKLYGLSSGAEANGYEQYEESVFHLPYAGNYYSEGNCGIVSLANWFRYAHDYAGFTDIVDPTDTTVMYPYSENPNLVTPASCWGYVPISNPRTIHSLPAKIREKAIVTNYMQNGYLGMDWLQMSDTFQQAAAEFGYQSSCQLMTSWTYGQLASEIDNGWPVTLSMTNDVHYLNHYSLITGYQLYQAEEWVPFLLRDPLPPILVYRYLPVVSIYDGHSHSERWYDLTSLGNLDSAYSRADGNEYGTGRLVVSQ